MGRLAYRIGVKQLSHTMMPIKSCYQDNPVFITKDGSSIRELMHPRVHGSNNQSLAEAVVAVGQRTLLHKHHSSEELYHITAGSGRMTLGDEVFDVACGDTVCIRPGTAHNIANTGSEPLHILCCCAPPYANEDTELVQDTEQ